jgi:hypothetical protein
MTTASSYNATLFINEALATEMDEIHNMVTDEHNNNNNNNNNYYYYYYYYLSIETM